MSAAKSGSLVGKVTPVQSSREATAGTQRPEINTNIAPVMSVATNESRESPRKTRVINIDIDDLKRRYFDNSLDLIDKSNYFPLVKLFQAQGDFENLLTLKKTRKQQQE